MSVDKSVVGTIALQFMELIGRDSSAELERVVMIGVVRLKDELLAFKPKPDKPDDLEGWRERPHDDLVLAVAVSTWAAQRFLRKERSMPLGALGAA
jgi:hypothetical protein